MHWKQLIDEVLAKKAAKKQSNSQAKKSYHRSNKKYELDAQCSGVSLTLREAQCVLLVLQGKTAIESADVLHLSRRTIEFYLANIKTKLKCRTKSKLIEKILKTNFMQLVDFDLSVT